MFVIITTTRFRGPLQGEQTKVAENSSLSSTSKGPDNNNNNTSSVEKTSVQSLLLSMAQKKPVDSSFISPSVNDATTVGTGKYYNANNTFC